VRRGAGITGIVEKQHLIVARKQVDAKNVSLMGTAKMGMIVMTLNVCG